MARHVSVGKLGEKLAAAWLLKGKFNILHRNWRFKHWEIDIIAEKENTLHFVEVKTRSNTDFGFPEEAVTSKKLDYLSDAATEFQYQNPQWDNIQFDILSIMLHRDKAEEYFFIEDIDL